MRVLLFLGALLSATPAFALSDSLIDYCLTTADPKACLHSVSTDLEQGRLDAQREMQQRQLEAQLEAAQIQANGLALFGSGPALIQGMNQGFQQMQLPYVSTPQFQYPPSRR